MQMTKCEWKKCGNVYFIWISFTHSFFSVADALFRGEHSINSISPMSELICLLLFCRRASGVRRRFTIIIWDIQIDIIHQKQLLFVAYKLTHLMKYTEVQCKRSTKNHLIEFIWFNSNRKHLRNLRNKSNQRETIAFEFYHVMFN